MSTPLVHIFTAQIQDGKAGAYRRYAREHAAFAEHAHPSLLAFHLYLSEDHRRIAAVQVHPNPDSMDIWIKHVVSEHGQTAYEFLQQGTERSLIYGTLNDHTLAGIRQYGAQLHLNPEHLAGFTRIAAS